MIKIAITGNIASGKSQAERIISQYYPVFDTDIIAHEILDTLNDFYGLDVFTNGKIDRKKLGDLVFSDTNIKEKLENLIHPLIKEKLNKIFELNKDKKYIFVSVPLLYETDFYKIFDKVLFISSEEKVRLNRLMKRNSFTEEEAVLRIKSQMDESEKIKKADYIIENNSTIEELKEKVIKFLKSIE